MSASNNVGTQMPISCLQTPCTSNFPELCEVPHPQALTSEGRHCAWFPHPPKSILSYIILGICHSQLGMQLRVYGSQLWVILPPGNNWQFLETFWAVTTGEREVDATGIRWVEIRNVARCPTMERTALYNKQFVWPQVLTEPRLGSPRLE